MAQNQIERLNTAVAAVKRYTRDRLPDSVETALYNLIGLDQEADLDLWEELRLALQSNTDLHELGYDLGDSEAAADGNWWLDPDHWTAQPTH